MKKILIFVILLALLGSNATAYSKEDIALSLKRQAKIHNIDKKVLYTIAKMESSFTPFVIAFVSSDRNVDVPNVKKKGYEVWNEISYSNGR